MEVRLTGRRRRSRAAGFSFIEVIIASLLMLMIAVSVLPMFTEAASSNVTGREYTEVANFARSRAEEFIQLPFNAEPLAITGGTERLHEEYYSAGFRKWLPGTVPAPGDRALWLRQTTIRQFKAADLETSANPLPAGSAPSDVDFKEVVVEVRGASVGSLFGPAKSITVRMIKAV